jgi:hypothetical protein
MNESEYGESRMNGREYGESRMNGREYGESVKNDSKERACARATGCNK